MDLRGDLPADHWSIPYDSNYAAVAGESHHRVEIESIVGTNRAGVGALVDADLIAEPDNPYDPNAVAVLISGRKCGHLGRADAPRWAPALARARELGLVLSARAAVIGGWQRPDGTWADYSIRLYVPSPEKVLADLRYHAVPRAERPYANTTCPYCGATPEPLPKAKSRCKVCGEAIYVRSGPDGQLYLLQEVDLPALEAAWDEARQEEQHP